MSFFYFFSLKSSNSQVNELVIISGMGCSIGLCWFQKIVNFRFMYGILFKF